MISQHNLEHLSMKGAAYYRIRVRGELSASMSDRLEGMKIESTFRKDGRAESVLEGRLGDQSALAGVLNTLYELHLPVVSADCLGAAEHENSN
jgi:hypothetical protein